jgi:mannitol-1-phosphate/altronate dehydrogenase
MALGIIGRMAGHTYSHEAIRDPAIREFITGLMDEMTQTLNPIKGVDLDEYKKTIITRLESPFMKDELIRLARNGVDKIDSRFLTPLRDAMARQTTTSHLTFAVAGWVEYLKRSGPDFDIQDDKAVAGKLPDRARAGGTVASVILANRDIFGHALAASHAFQNRLEDNLIKICNNPDNILEVLRTLKDGQETGQPAKPAFTTPAP